MSTYQGFGGRFVAGGIVDGSPILNGALASGTAVMAVDAVATINGVIFAGDTFTIAGETGSPTHTVTGGPYVIANSSVTSVAFTPAVATGGVGDNAALSFTANSVSQVQEWEFTVSRDPLEYTSLGDVWRKFVGGEAVFRGSARVVYDYGDTKQSQLVARLVTATPDVASYGLVFRVSTSKQHYGTAILTNFSIEARTGQLITAALEFQGDGSLLTNWAT